MNRPLAYRGLALLAVVGLAGLTAYPLDENLNLGLDLRGGIHLVLQVEVADAIRSETQKDMDRLLRELQDEGLTAATAEQVTDSSFEVRGVGAGSDATVREAAEDFLQIWDWSRRGEVLAFDLPEQELRRIREQAVGQAQETIRNRIDAYGVSEPVIQRQGLEGNRIVVQLPGVDDPERVRQLIKSTAFLEFRLVDFPPGGGGVPTREQILQNYGGQVPATVEIMTGIVRDDLGEAIGTNYYAVETRRVITGRDLRDARPGLGQFNQPIVNFFLTAEGGRLFADATGANVGKGLAIVLDGNVVSAPNIRSQIRDQGQIEGAFTQQEVEDLSTVLRSGALPAGITYLEDRTVGPSLGQDSIERGLRAGVIGLVLVALTMLVVYKLTGVNAVVALALNMVLVFGCLAAFGATLTLPGIAGIVLTIGMAVDANVLVFERIREELRRGRTVRSSIQTGFSKAYSSIFDANVTTLIAAVFLFNFGTGPIRGFAVTLSIGIMASLFTAILVSRWIFDVVQSRKARGDKMSI